MKEHIYEIVDDIYGVDKEIPGVEDPFTFFFIKDCDVLIETGPGSLIPTILAAAKELGITDLQYIIPSHIHMDHGGASGELARIFTRATVVANSQGAKHLIDPSRLINSTEISFGNDFRNTYGSLEPVPESRVKVIQDGDGISVNGRNLVFFDSPGHAPHHITVFDEKSGGLFCGEALGLIYQPGAPPLASAAPPSFDFELYVGTMERLRELPLKFLFYSHGGVSREPVKSITTAIENVKTIGEYILQALRSNTEETAASKFDNYMVEKFGVKLSEQTLMNNMNGYGIHFKKKGLV